ncbi:unnamed protein product [Brassica napus]|uniref:(rape) hypothetical protein n=1 Tax=Brassica napus TaxID=3708 RepID=A0A816KIR1_BRANA|nr:unnamed protein product [Brassica napus]
MDFVLTLSLSDNPPGKTYLMEEEAQEDCHTVDHFAVDDLLVNFSNDDDEENDVIADSDGANAATAVPDNSNSSSFSTAGLPIFHGDVHDGTSFSSDFCVPEQTLTRRHMQLGLKWASHGSSLRQPVHRRNRSLQPPPFSADLADVHRSSREKANNRRTPAEEGYISGIRQRRGTAVSPLRHRQDAAVADWPNGPEDICAMLVASGISRDVWCRSTGRWRVPDIRAGQTFECSVESDGAPAEEGDD